MAWIDFSQLRQLVTCRDVAEHEGLEIDRSGRTRCPWCASAASRFNLAFNADGTAHCYRCGETHDAIDLAQRLWRVSKADAARQLITIFKLGVSDEKPDDEQRQQRRQQREDELREAWVNYRVENELMGSAADELRESEADLMAFTGTDWTPDLVAKLQRVSRARARWWFLWATYKPIRRPPDPQPDRRQLEAAVRTAQAEQAAAWAAVRVTDATAANYGDLQRRARNADQWLRLKKAELANLGGRADA